MAKTVDYYFTTVSPWSFIGHERFARFAAQHGAKINVKPVDYGKIFPASGGLPLKARAPQRQAYRLVELRRWREHFAMRFNVQPKHFPVPADGAACLIIATDLAHGTQAAMDMALALYRACWVEERDVSDPETLRAVAREQGRDPDALLSEASVARARAKFEAYTQEAIDRGVFGAPTYIVNGEPFWGQDRLDFVEKALAA